MTGTFLCTSFAVIAEGLDTKFNRLIRRQRQIGEHFAQSHPWTELFSDEQTVASELTQSGFYGIGNT